MDINDPADESGRTDVMNTLRALTFKLFYKFACGKYSGSSQVKRGNLQRTLGTGTS